MITNHFVHITRLFSSSWPTLFIFKSITHCVRGSPKAMWFGLNRWPRSYQDHRKTSAKSAATKCCHWIPCCGGSEYVEVKRKRWGSRPAEREGGPAEPETGWEKKSGGTNKSVFPLHMPTVWESYVERSHPYMWSSVMRRHKQHHSRPFCLVLH